MPVSSHLRRIGCRSSSSVLDATWMRYTGGKAMDFEVTPVSGGVGVEVVGLDQEAGIAEETARALRRVWLDAGVVQFRGLGTWPEALVVLWHCFGELEHHTIEHIRLPGYPDMNQPRNEGGM